jgi:hypothetical protein
MKKVIFLFLSCAAIFTSLELATFSLNPVLADSTQDSGDRPINLKPPSAGKPSGLAEKGKPILAQNVVICPQILKTYNNSNKTSENVEIPPEGKGQVSSSCLQRAK